MHHISYAVLSLALLLSTSGCHDRATSEAAAATAPVRGKPGAPVTVSAELARNTARVTVRFDAPVGDVRVRVHGVDGLVVTSDATPIDARAFARGDVRTFDVAFTPGRDRSHLVVSVSATQGGTPRTTVSSFAVGTAQTGRRSTGAVTTTDGSGERVRLMPVEGR